MQILHDVNIDWMAKAKFFIGLSLFLLLIGGYSLYSKGGPRYGIDFKGGTLVYVRFTGQVPVDKIRTGLRGQGLGDSQIQEIRDLARPGSNEVVIGLEQKGNQDEALDTGKAAILTALRRIFGEGEAGKQDLNAVTLNNLSDYLLRKDPLGLGSQAGDRYKELAGAILKLRDTELSGLITDYIQLKTVPGMTEGVLGLLRSDFYLSQFAVRNVEIVGPKVGEQLRKQAVWATLYALAGMLVYIAFRFEWIYGAAAVLAVFHDVLITLGFFSLFGYEISLTVIAALLTLVGYSMNDTIVIFDRMRENLRLMRREPLAVIVNRSINQTLSRTILTSGLTFITVIVLFAMGGDVLRAFSFALVVGIVVGTYSSVGIAVPLVVAWTRWRGHGPLVGSGSRARTEAL